MLALGSKRESIMPQVSKFSQLQRQYVIGFLIALSLSACIPKTATIPNQMLSGVGIAATNKVAITITDGGCIPKQLSVAAGKIIFEITNKSRQPLAWEVLDGIKVLEGYEDIAPGFSQILNTQLEAGDYSMGCGLRSNPKGQLMVKAATAAQATAGMMLNELAAPTAEYKTYINQEIDQLVVNTKAFANAVITDDIAKAKQLYAPTRTHLGRAEPVVELFSDLNRSIDARENSFAMKADDPNFTGFHRIEKALFQGNTTNGMKPIAQKLIQDTLELQKQVAALSIEPKEMVEGALVLIEEVIATKISGEEDLYSGTDLWNIIANVEGAQKIVELLRSVVSKANPDLQRRVDAAFIQVNATLAKYKTSDGKVEAYDQLSVPDRNDLKAFLITLSEDLSTYGGVLKVN